jgi:hypothetical protein
VCEELFDGCADGRCRSRSNYEEESRPAAWKHLGQVWQMFREALGLRIAYRKLPPPTRSQLCRLTPR